jgi:ADP-heptose:LPS heptosyltransferase
MSNILIIKLGSLGDVVQISGALKDIRNFHKNDKIYILTTSKFINLFKACPYIDECIKDENKPRFNFFYLLNLKKNIKKYNFKKVYDLQNSNRTIFYRKYLFNIKDWSSARDLGYKESSVLKGIEAQLKKSGVPIQYSLNPDFTWAAEVSQDFQFIPQKKFILFFPFSSKKLSHKRWPYFYDLVNLIKKFHSEFELVLAPSNEEIKDAQKYNVTLALDHGKALNFFQLATLIKKSNLVIANDTGPAHMAAHLGAKGFVLFGSHTTPEKVSIERKKFIALQVEDLKKLTADRIYALVKSSITS